MHSQSDNLTVGIFVRWLLLLNYWRERKKLFTFNAIFLSFCFRVWGIICTKGLFVGATYYLIYLVNGNKFLITNDCLRVRYKSYTFPGYDPRKLESAGNYSHIDFTQNFWRVIWLRLFISFICSSQWSNQRNSRMDDLMTPLMDDLMTLNEFGSELLSTWGHV